MAFKFRPVDGTFFDALTQLALKLQEGADMLAEILDDQSNKTEIAERLSIAESEADTITNSIIRQVNQTFITPIDREDIYEMATKLDSVMNRMDEAADLIMLYGVQALPKEFAKQVAVLQRCAELTVDAMPRLASRGELSDYWTEIKRLESSGDKQYRRILAKLFDGRYEPLEVLKLKDVIEAMESAIDGFERVAKTVEQIAVKES